MHHVISIAVFQSKDGRVWFPRKKNHEKGILHA